MNVLFADHAVGRLCNRKAATEHEWGEAGADVRESLSALHASPSAAAYEDHPNVTTEGDKTVFKGRHADVILNLTEKPGPPLEVVVDAIDVRDRTHTQ